MNCFTLAALGLRLLSNGDAVDPAAIVRTECGIELALGERGDHLVAEAGLSLRVPGVPLRVGAGAIVDRHHWMRTYSPNPPSGAHGPTVISITAAEADWRVRGRIDAAIEVPIAPRWRLTLGAEALPRAAGRLAMEYRF